MSAFAKMLLIGVAFCTPIFSQQTTQGKTSQMHRRTFLGWYDADVSTPLPEGKSGTRDPAAVAILQAANNLLQLQKNESISLQGTLIADEGKRSKSSPATIIFEHGDRVRLDPTDHAAFSDVREFQGQLKLKSESGASFTGYTSCFGEPLTFPWKMRELMETTDTSFVSDGSVQVAGKTFSRVTVTRCAHEGTVGLEAMSLYFDLSTHLLVYTTLLEHAPQSSAITGLLVVTYGDYSAERQSIVPHVFQKTLNGQLLTRFKVSSVQEQSEFPNSYFVF